jgi:hypothetical protein
LTEWSFNGFIVPAKQFKTKWEKKKDLETFQNEIKQSCPSLQLMNDITDGTKHFSLNRTSTIKETNLHSGSYDQSFSHSFDISYLYIVEGKTKINFEDAIQEVVSFWKGYLISINKKGINY